MAEFNQAQLDAMGALLAGTHANVDPTYSIPSGPEVVFPTPSGLTSRSVQTYAVDNSGNPILNQQNSNAVAQALASTGRANGRASGGGVAEALAGMGAANQPSGTIVAGKNQDRLTPNQFGFGENGPAGGVVPNDALAAIEALAPRFDPINPLGGPTWLQFDDYINNTDAFGPRGKPKTMLAEVEDVGQFGIPMSPGMKRNIATKATVTGVPGVGAAAARPALNKTQVALAGLAKPTGPKITAATYVPVPQTLSNGVANPAYRDYTPTYTTDNGGQMPAAAYGGDSGSSFTDSLGGTYYDRHL